MKNKMDQAVELVIRKGKKEDIPQVLMLIKELAEYERAPHEVTNSVEDMERDGFGENPVFGFFVAEKAGKLVGLSLYYYRYSTWKGKCIYLEDLIVTESERNRGTGKLLLDKTIDFAKSNGLKRVVWQVLEWNSTAIDFYKKYPVKFDQEWINCILDL